MSTAPKRPRHRQLRRAAAIALGIAIVATGCSTEQDDGTSTEPVSTPSTTSTPTPAPEPPPLEALLTADVPSLCEHPAGSLEDGALPGITAGDGRVMLSPATVEAAQDGAESAPGAVRHFDAHGEPFIAAIVHCDRGGVRWPDQVVVWDAAMDVIDVFEPSQYPEPYAAGERQSLWDITAEEDGFHARWVAMGPHDPACCGQLSMEMSVQVDDGIVAGALTTHRGEAQVTAAFAAAHDGAEAPDVDVPDRFYADVGSTLEDMQSIDPDGVTCIDTEFGQAPSGGAVPTLTCGVPGVFENGADVAFVVYVALDEGWNDYEITSMEPSLSPLE